MKITIENILKITSEETGISLDDIRSSSRKREIANARFIAMSAIKKLIPETSLNAIGRAFERDHSTVMNALQKAEWNIQYDNNFHRLIQNVLTHFGDKQKYVSPYVYPGLKLEFI
jgi:chromosomal replication initiator protein